MVAKGKAIPAVAMESNALVGMKEICAFMHRSEPTVLKLVEQYQDSIPIKKVSGVWESDRLELERWRREVLLAPAGIKPVTPVVPEKAPEESKKEEGGQEEQALEGKE